jgi:hypothetical protein
MTRPRTWTDDQLAKVLASGECRNWMDVVVMLGLGPHAVNRTNVKRRAERLGLTLLNGRRAR